MSDESSPADLPPGPYSYQTISSTKAKHPGNGHVYILDANGRKIAGMWGTGPEKMALAQLILDARDQVK